MSSFQNKLIEICNVKNGVVYIPLKFIEITDDFGGHVFFEDLPKNNIYFLQKLAFLLIKNNTIICKMTKNELIQFLNGRIVILDNSN